MCLNAPFEHFILDGTTFGVVFIVALVDIAEGSEILVDYG